MNELFVILTFVFITCSCIIFFAGNWLYQRLHNLYNKRLEYFTAQLQLLHIFINVRLLLVAYFGLLILGPIVFILFNISLIIILSWIIVLLIVPRVIIQYIHKKRITQFESQLPDCLTQIAGSLRCGSSFINAVDLLIEDTPGPIAQEFGLMIKEYRLGQTLETALNRLGERLANDNLNLVISTTLIANELGGNLAETYDRLAHTLQQKLMIEKKIDAFTSQGKLQGIVVGALPVGMVLVLSTIEPAAMMLLFKSWLGWITLLVLIILEILGMFFIRKVVNIEV